MPSLVDTKNLVKLLKNKKTIINTALVLSVLIISSNIYSRLSRINVKIKDQVVLETKRNNLLKQIAASEKNIAYYKELLKNKEATTVITAVNIFAQDAGLDIASVKPESLADNPIYSKLAIRISILADADSYHKIGDFISKLESSNDLYKVEGFYIRPYIQEAERGLSVEIIVSRITFKG